MRAEEASLVQWASTWCAVAGSPEVPTHACLFGHAAIGQILRRKAETRFPRNEKSACGNWESYSVAGYGNRPY